MQRSECVILIQKRLIIKLSLSIKWCITLYVCISISLWVTWFQLYSTSRQKRKKESRAPGCRGQEMGREGKGRNGKAVDMSRSGQAADRKLWLLLPTQHEAQMSTFISRREGYKSAPCAHFQQSEDQRESDWGSWVVPWWNFTLCFHENHHRANVKEPLSQLKHVNKNSYKLLLIFAGEGHVCKTCWLWPALVLTFWLFEGHHSLPIRASSALWWIYALFSKVNILIHINFKNTSLRRHFQCSSGKLEPLHVLGLGCHWGSIPVQWDSSIPLKWPRCPRKPWMEFQAFTAIHNTLFFVGAECNIYSQSGYC